MRNGWFWLVAQVADSQARRADFHINEQLEATGESLLHLVSRRQTDYVSVCIYVLIGSVLGRCQAAWHGHAHLVERLLDLKASVNLRDSVLFSTLIHTKLLFDIYIILCRLRCC